MNGNKRKLARNIMLFIALCISFPGCTDLSMLGKEAEIEFNEASVAADAATLTDAAITFTSGDTAAAVTTEFSLPISGYDGSTITWSSSDTDIITINEDGSTTVNRPSGSNVVVELTATITKGTVTTTKIIIVTILAVEVVNHTITFDANGGSGSMNAQTIAQGTAANLTANAFTRAGYTFAGWDDDSDGVVDYADGASYTIGSSDVTLYAVWRANLSISSITPDGETSVSPDTNIVLVFSGSLDGTTKGTVSFASPVVTFTDGVNASIAFSTTTNANDTITINPTLNLQQTNYSSITVSGFRDSYSTDVNASDSTYYFPVRGAMDLYFPFTNGSLEDASGRGVTLQKYGDPTLTEGHNGSANGAYIFDGAGDYMQVIGDLGISAGDDFTISAWIKLDTGFLNFNAIVSNYHNNGLKALMFRVNSSWNGHTNALDLAEGYSNNGVLSTGTWLHVVGVYDNATRQVRFYVNGNDAGTGTSSYRIEDQTTKFAIGGDYLNVSPRYFNGIIDEVRFYKYDLTSTEVGNLYYNDDINDSSRP